MKPENIFEFYHLAQVGFMEKDKFIETKFRVCFLWLTWWNAK